MSTTKGIYYQRNFSIALHHKKIFAYFKPTVIHGLQGDY